MKRPVQSQSAKRGLVLAGVRTSSNCQSDPTPSLCLSCPIQFPFATVSSVIGAARLRWIL